MRRRTAGWTMIAGLTATLALAACGGSSSSDGSNGAATSTVSASCKPAHHNLKTVHSGTLSVNAYVSPPYTVQNGNTITGLDGTIVKRLAAMECLKLTIQSVAGAALPATIQAGRADIAIGGVYASKERAQTFELTRTMYYDRPGLLSKTGIDSLSGLAHGTLGVIQGYLWNAEFAKALGSSHIRTYQTSAALISDIENGRVTAGVFTSAEAQYRAAHGTSLKAALLQPTPQIVESQHPSKVVLLLNKHATGLTTALNADIGVLLRDGFIARTLKANGLSPSLAASVS